MAKEITNNQVVEILRKEIGGVRDELKADIGSLRGELKAEIQSTKVEVKSARAETQSVKKDLIKKIDEDTGFLARITNSNFTKVENKIGKVELNLTKKIEEDTEFIARITQDGFREAEEKHNKAHKIIRQKIKEVKLDASGIRKIAMSKVKRDDNQDFRIKLIGKRVKVLEKQVL